MTKSAQLFETFFNTVVKMRRILDSAITESFEQKTATLLQFQVLKQINDNPQLTVGELSRYLGLSYSSTSQLTDKLAERRLLERQSDSSDRRSVRLILTKAGKKTYQKNLKKVQAQVNKIFTFLPEKDMKQVVNIFNNFLAKHEKNALTKTKKI